VFSCMASIFAFLASIISLMAFRSFLLSIFVVCDCRINL
jgi:hypothetical protein